MSVGAEEAGREWQWREGRSMEMRIEMKKVIQMLMSLITISGGNPPCPGNALHVFLRYFVTV